MRCAACACLLALAVAVTWYGENTCTTTLQLDQDGTFRLRVHIALALHDISGDVVGRWRRSDRGVALTVDPDDSLSALPVDYFQAGLQVAGEAERPELKAAWPWAPKPLRWFGQKPDRDCD